MVLFVFFIAIRVDTMTSCINWFIYIIEMISYLRFTGLRQKTKKITEMWSKMMDTHLTKNFKNKWEKIKNVGMSEEKIYLVV